MLNLITLWVHNFLKLLLIGSAHNIKQEIQSEFVILRLVHIKARNDESSSSKNVFIRHIEVNQDLFYMLSSIRHFLQENINELLKVKFVVERSQSFDQLVFTFNHWVFRADAIGRLVVQ
jgi:hypothetical protein